jgi:hypothetical protein
LSPEQVQDLDNALQELKFKFMSQGASGTTAIDTALNDLVNGKTVRQVLELGLSAKLERLEQQRTALTTMIGQNAMLVTRDGDGSSADYLKRKRDEQTAKRDAIDKEMDGVRERMRAAGITPPAPSTDAASDAAPAGTLEEHPDTMPQLERKG